MTPRQCKAARELLGWSRDKLYAESGSTVAIIAAYEREGRVIQARHSKGVDHLDRIRTALEQAGVEFTNGDGPGVRLGGKP